MEEPFCRFKTCDYLRQDNYFTFYPPVEELQGEPNYYISDADRLFWWDGTEEVTISEETDEWLKELEKQYQELLDEELGVSDVVAVFRDFIGLISEINQYYFQLYPFESMFNEFTNHLANKEYRAAIKLIRRVSEKEEIREAGKIVQNRSYSEMENKNVLENAGRLQLKRLYAVLANKTLRKLYFDF